MISEFELGSHAASTPKHQEQDYGKVWHLAKCNCDGVGNKRKVYPIHSSEKSRCVTALLA